MPTVTLRENFSPVRPSNSSDWPDVSNPARASASLTSCSLAPSKTGVAIGTPRVTLPAASTSMSSSMPTMPSS